MGKKILLCVLLALLAACAGGGAEDSPTPTPALAGLYDGVYKDAALATAAEADARGLATALNSYLTLYAANGRAKDFSQNPDAGEMARYLLDNAGDVNMTFGVTLPYFADADAGNRAIDNIEYSAVAQRWDVADSVNYQDAPVADVYSAE